MRFGVNIFFLGLFILLNMPETILNRIGRILSGTAHSIVEKIENQNPDALLQDAISEIDNAIRSAKAELGRLEVQKREIQNTITSFQNELDTLEAQIKTAFKLDRRELVKIGLGRQVDIEGQLIPLKNQLQSFEQSEQEYNQAISGLIAKRNQMEDDLHHYNEVKASEYGESVLEVDPSNLIPSILKADTAESKFNRVLSKANARRTGMSSSDSETELLIELANLERTAKIEKKLKELEDAGSVE